MESAGSVASIAVPERKHALLELGAQPLAVLDRIAAILKELRDEA